MYWSRDAAGVRVRQGFKGFDLSQTFSCWYLECVYYRSCGLRDVNCHCVKVS
jgi:hypothetical protein